MLSALTTTPLHVLAKSIAKADLPLAVGPAMRIGASGRMGAQSDVLAMDLIHAALLA
jgi:hypothetical protein